MIDREMTVGNRAVPDFMIALPRSHVFAATFQQQLLEFAEIAGHALSKLD
ncbi:hypothetical protein RHECNPAF_2760026 [Rhizobium etli CNPAF512]|nr:hypothetical protein RHECNPAF_2760026 [Rhizobium etli CNPAF512]